MLQRAACSFARLQCGRNIWDEWESRIRVLTFSVIGERGKSIRCFFLYVRLAVKRTNLRIPHVFYSLGSCAALCLPEPRRAPVLTPARQLTCCPTQKALGFIQGQLRVPYGKATPDTYVQSISETRRGVEEHASHPALSFPCL